MTHWHEKDFRKELKFFEAGSIVCRQLLEFGPQREEFGIYG